MHVRDHAYGCKKEGREGQRFRGGKELIRKDGVVDGRSHLLNGVAALHSDIQDFKVAGSGVKPSMKLIGEARRGTRRRRVFFHYKSCCGGAGAIFGGGVGGSYRAGV